MRRRCSPPWTCPPFGWRWLRVAWQRGPWQRRTMAGAGRAPACPGTRRRPRGAADQVAESGSGDGRLAGAVGAEGSLTGMSGALVARTCPQPTPLLSRPTRTSRFAASRLSAPLPARPLASHSGQMASSTCCTIDARAKRILGHAAVIALAIPAQARQAWARSARCWIEPLRQSLTCARTHPTAPTWPEGLKP